MEFRINIALVQTQLVIRKGVTQILYESIPVSPEIADCLTEAIHEFHESSAPSMVVVNPPEKQIPIFEPTPLEICGPKIVYAAVWEHNGEVTPPQIDADAQAPR